MKLANQLLRTFLIWFTVLILILLLTLFPRDYWYAGEGKIGYDFSFEEYSTNILTLLGNLRMGEGLGEDRFGEPVVQILERYVPRSLKLILAAFLISIPLGIWKGIFDYRHNKTKWNLFGNGTTWTLQSIPDFFTIILIQWIAILLMRAGFPDIPIYGYDDRYSFIFPSIILSFYPTVYIARVTSSLLVGQEHQPYLQTAKSKGASDRKILYRHVLGNCWTVIFTHFSSVMLYILSNLLIVEYLIFYKGAGYRLWQAMGFHNANLTGSYKATANGIFEANVVIGITIFFMLLVLLAQWTSQITKYYIDPRLRGE
jgi:oligopeptide transport system permease protein